MRNSASLRIFHAGVFGREQALPCLHPRGMLLVRRQAFRIFNGIFGAPVYGRGNVILLEGICSPAPFVSVEMCDECARPFDHGGGVVRQFHGCAYLTLVL